MKAFTKITAIVAPLDRSNVDTDAIIPKQFLKSRKVDEFQYLKPILEPLNKIWN